MGKTITRKLLAVVLTLTLVISGSALAFATNDSPGGGQDVPEATVKVTAVSGNYGNSTITVKYTGTNASKYRIYYKLARATRWSYVVSKDQTSFTLNASNAKIRQGFPYYIKVVPVNADGKTLGKSSAVYKKYVNRVVSKVTALSGGKVKVTAKKANGSTGYEIRYSTNKDMSNATVVTVKTGGSLNKTLTLKSKKTYYFRVRPIYVANGDKFVGILDALKTVKTKA